MSQGLFAAVSGIRANQTRMNVISNNVANSNTVGFKGANVNFSNIFSQTLFGGSRPNGSIGGINPRQIGNGAQVSEIVTNFAQGASQFTGKATDLLVNGDGFFTVESPDATSSTVSSNYFLTRAGNFNMDANGNLVTTSGYRVRGTSQLSSSSSATLGTVKIPQDMKISKIITTATGAMVSTQIATAATADASFTAAGAGQTRTISSVKLTSFSIGADGAVTATYSNGDRFSVRTDSASVSASDPTAARREVIHLTAEGTTSAGVTAGSGEVSLTQVAGGAVFEDGSGTASLRGMQMQLQTATVVNSSGLSFSGDNYFVTTPNSGTTSFGIPNSENRGGVQSGSLESSNVDLATEFTNLIVTQRGLDSNTRVIRTHNDVFQSILGLFQ